MAMKQLPKISPEVLALAVVAAAILGYGLKILLTRIIGHILEVSLGLLLAFGIYILCIIWLPELNQNSVNNNLIIPRYAFVDESNWSNELLNLSSEKILPSPVVPDSFVLSDSIDGLLELINRDFIQSWYSKFSADKVFSSSIDNLSRSAIRELGNRLNTVEWADFLVGSIMPLVTDHFSRYVVAVSVIRERSGGHLTQSNELDYEIASQYQKLYDGSSKSLFLSKNFEYESNRKKWLIRKTEKILPLLFSKVNKRELESKIVTKLLTEIIANSILLPILKMTSDADFWNQIVIKSAGSTIQDQNKVKRLRQALDEHTGSKGAGSGIQNKLNDPPRQLRLRFSPNSDQHKFDKFIRNIYKCQSLAEARQTRYYISVQLQRAVKDGNDKIFISRLEEAKLAIEKQISILSGESTIVRGSDTIIKPPPSPGTVAGAVLMSSMGRSSPSPMLAANSSLFLPPSTERKKSPLPGASLDQSDYSLLDILNDSACSLYFMEYMDQRRHTDLLQFWLTVNSLWKQDEDENFLSHSNTLDQQDPLGGFSIGDVTNKDSIVKENELFVDDGTSKDDILQIYSKYFIDEHHMVREITPEANQAVSNFINSQNATISQYKNARDAILATQSAVYKTLEIRYLPRFKKSDLYLKYLASNPPPINRIRSTIDNLQMDAVNDDNSTATVLDRSQNAKVVLAVEEAFQDIMSGSISSLTPKTNIQSGTDIKPKERAGFVELIGDDVGDETSSNKTPEKRKREALFDSDDNYQNGNNSDEENDEFSLVNSSTFPDVHLAAPGDLGLTEAISILSKEIENLYNQEEVVDFLLKKAELTNNQSQLRILQKSKASLEREIHRKELQRQQYIVQESENSLFGKSDIQIQSYVYGVEDGGEYVLYIIEVQKLDYEGNQTAGWIVARRYSQFFDLHQHLKDQFPRVKKLDFPRKRVLLKFQPKALVDSRRIALEKYLKQLLEIPEVCQSKAFRLFLSSETFSVDSLATVNSSSSHSPSGSPSLANSSISFSESDDMPNKKSSLPTVVMESTNELNEGVKSDTVGRSLFIQPICDLFIQVFGVDAGDNWLRGRAVVVVLQQLLGGTIEKKVREVVSSLTSVKSITGIIEMVRDSVWPGGILKQSSPPRTASEKIKTRHDAMILLQQLIHTASARVIGGSSSRYAARHLFGMYQNQILNTHLVYSLLDMILQELFPELSIEDD